MERMSISTFCQFLSTITVDDIHVTLHFAERVGVRFGEGINEIYKFIFDCDPVGVLEQDTGKFKVLYNYNEEYDLSIVFSVKDENPIRISLVTCFKEPAKRRQRPDEQEHC